MYKNISCNIIELICLEKITQNGLKICSKTRSYKRD